MKRYLLFYNHAYYPLGGFFDYQGAFDSVEEAVAKVPTKGYAAPDWYHVIDAHNGMECVAKSGSTCYTSEDDIPGRNNLNG
jgi:hypothetical protein